MAYKVTSKKINKIHKKLYNAPLHKRYKELTAPLSELLVKEHEIKNLPVRKGDTVLIVRGEFAGHEGKVVKVSLRRRRIYIEGVTRNKADGTAVSVPVHASKVVITKLNLSDEERRKIIERKRHEK